MAVLKREFLITTPAVVVLVLLRIGIGWHFLHEGIWKAEQPEFSAEPYLRQAKGPLANWYRDLVPDRAGQRRLDIDAMREHWKARLAEAEKHFGYRDAQKAAAQRALAQRLSDLDDFLREDKTDDNGEPVKASGKVVRDYKPGVRVYKTALERWAQHDPRDETHDVPFEQKRHWDKLVEMQQTAAPWLAEVDRMDRAFHEDLHRVAIPEVREVVGELPKEAAWLDWLEVLTTYGLIGIGLCLMLGFATRLAALGGAVFLLTAVVLPQLAFGHEYPPPPPSAGHTFLVNKEVIEMLALTFIALTAVGRWGGLDYIGHGLFTRYYGAVGGFIKLYVGKALEHAMRILLKVIRRGKDHAPNA
jgi:uncharacterized membrane protein YphA (DoxX/SURF4 family)